MHLCRPNKGVVPGGFRLIKIKNVRPGILIIADAGLKLAPGEVVPVENLSRQSLQAISDGLLVRMDEVADTNPKSKAVSRASESKKTVSKSAVKEQTPAVEENSGQQQGENQELPLEDESQKQPVEEDDGS